MDHKPKSITKAGIKEANNKAERYRFLNQPEEAESICLDVLTVDPENQLAWRNLGLAITDQFTGKANDRHSEAELAFEKLTDRYERLYYMGIMHERRAKSQLRAGHLPHTLLVIFEEAMRCFEEAQKLSPSANDDAILHWNTCVRLLQSRADSDWHREHQEIEGIDAGDSQPMYSKK
jgi:tetratricopeptide (TPR) repeat protein